MNAKEKKWLLLVLILTGLVIGGLLGSLTKDINGLSWLNYGKSFGLSTPVVLSLEIIELTFGIMLHFNVSSIIGMIIGILIYTRIK